MEKKKNFHVLLFEKKKLTSTNYNYIYQHIYHNIYHNLVFKNMRLICKILFTNNYLFIISQGNFQVPSRQSLVIQQPQTIHHKVPWIWFAGCEGSFC